MLLWFRSVGRPVSPLIIIIYAAKLYVQLTHKVTEVAGAHLL